jgi:EmrB/QacA subfamily drug resistance transporter
MATPTAARFPSQTDPREPHHLRRDVLLAVASVAQFMVVLDVTIINVALPEIRTALHMSTAGQQWVINAYTLTFAGFLMLGGRAADLFGRRRVFLVGLGIFTACSLLGGLAQNAGVLIAARAAQGIGGAILAPASLSLLTATFTEHHERRRALGVWSATAASGAAGGLFLGGVLTGLLGWRWVLFVNVPVGLALLGLSRFALTESTGQDADRRLDIAGAAALTLGTATVVYGIVGTDAHPWTAAQTIGTLAAGVILLAAFIVIEARYARSPIVPLSTFRRRSLSIANVISAALGAVVFGLYFFLSLYLQEVKGYSPLHAGLAFLPVGVATFAAALAAGPLVRHLGVRRQLILAPLLSCGAAFWLSQLGPASGYFPGLLVPLLLAGAGIGLTFVPLTLAATAGVAPSQAGLASGLLNTSRQKGGAIGLAVLATVAASVSRHQLAEGHAQASALTHGYGLAFLIIAALSAAGALTACLLGRGKTTPAPGPEAEPVAFESCPLRRGRSCDRGQVAVADGCCDGDLRRRSHDSSHHAYRRHRPPGPGQPARQRDRPARGRPQPRRHPGRYPAACRGDPGIARRRRRRREGIRRSRRCLLAHTARPARRKR